MVNYILVRIFMGELVIMYILNLNLSLLYNIGAISKNKIIDLKKTFKDYPEFAVRNSNNLIIKKGLDVIIVEQNRIAFLTQGDSNEINLNNMLEELAKLRDNLNLPQDSIFVLQIEALENFDINLFEKSRLILNDSASKINAKGIGFRFILDRDNIQGDIHIEPFLKDEQKAYFNVILQSKNNIDINNKDFVHELYDFAVRSTQEIAHDLFE